jgi:NAD(P)-dependent dehydrogenase (short-subunit alcohol dehydrogenase family)
MTMQGPPSDALSSDALRGRVAVITGAGGAIAGAIARSLVKVGAAAVLGDIDEDRLAGVVASCAEGADVTSAHCDVTDPDELRALLRLAVERHGRVDVLVNAAGIIHVDELLDLELATWRRVFGVNVEGALLATQEAVRIMDTQDVDATLGRRGLIVNISSQAAEWPLPDASAYGASKAALNYLTTVTATVGAERAVGAISVYPGMVYGGLWEQVNRRRADKADRPLEDVAKEHLAESIGGFQDPDQLAAIVVRAVVRPGLELSGRVIWTDPHES